MFSGKLAALYETGYLPAEVEAKSLITGKLYQYIAAGESPLRAVSESIKYIVLYDDHEFSNGRYQCVMAPGFGQSIDREKLPEELTKRGIPMDELPG